MKQIILLHGALGASVQLEDLSNLLTKKGFQTFLYNFSGHGKTVFSNEFSVEKFSDELRQLIVKNELKGPTVFGYSMGGYVALALARKEPELQGKIITLGTKFTWSKEIAEHETRRLNPDVIERKIPKFAKILEDRHGPEWKNLVRKTAALMTDLGNRNVIAKDDFKEIRNTTLVGIADKDEMVSFEETHDAFKKLPHAAMYMLPCSAHQLETVNMRMLADIINDFAGEEAE